MALWSFLKSARSLALGAAAVEDTRSQPRRPIDRLLEIHRMVMDPDQTFSISATLEELAALEEQVVPGDLHALGEVNFSRNYVLRSADRMDEALPASREALRLDALVPFLTAWERSRLMYNHATEAQECEAWDDAIATYQQLIPRFLEHDNVTEDQRLGTRERLAFCLHEARRYAEALGVNREVLAGGEALFGTDSAKLLTVLTNLAQNAYELGLRADAKAWLERRLALASAHADSFHTDDSLFQLGVLASEQGLRNEAEAWMRQRLALAEQSHDEDRVTAARDALGVLYQKAGGEAGFSRTSGDSCNQDTPKRSPLCP